MNHQEDTDTPALVVPMGITIQGQGIQAALLVMLELKKMGPTLDARHVVMAISVPVDLIAALLVVQELKRMGPTLDVLHVILDNISRVQVKQVVFLALLENIVLVVVVIAVLHAVLVITVIADQVAVQYVMQVNIVLLTQAAVVIVGLEHIQIKEQGRSQTIFYIIYITVLV